MELSWDLTGEDHQLKGISVFYENKIQLKRQWIVLHCRYADKAFLKKDKTNAAKVLTALLNLSIVLQSVLHKEV